MYNKHTTSPKGYLLGAFLILVVLLNAQEPPDYRFKRWTLQDGLSNNSIRMIAQDEKGFLWLGTNGGLNRYDGQSFLPFRFDPENSASISDNVLTCVLIDQQQHIWLGTINGLSCLNTNNGRIKRIQLRRDSARNVPYFIKGIYEDKRADLWVTTGENGLFQLRRVGEDSVAIVGVYFEQVDGSSIDQNSSPFVVHEDEKGYLWLASGQGVFRASLEAMELERLDFPLSKAEKNMSRPIRNWLIDWDGK
ncbi:MAG: two-component regulator propeller domain-containing protein, partial [Bacteroidota bacterium]